ncbi:MAG: COQ9 family protein [Alphaproteobacteria bacterium]|nr:COQ9 family protein [Alphaproteobacteria bacterium]
MADHSDNRVQQRMKLLEAILPHVAFDGWTDDALRAGAVDAGMDDIAVDRFFPGGAREIAAAFSEWADQKMLEALATQDVDGLKLRERVALAVRLRLEALAPHRETVRRTVAFLSLPGNISRGGKGVYKTVDAIWYAVGDRSSDFSFYTKRALLAGVVTSTSLFWLDDDSDDCVDSWAFLDRRIADVMKIPALRGRLEKIACRLPDPFKILRAVRAR